MIMLKKSVESKMRIIFVASLACAFIASGCGAESSPASNEQENDSVISSDQPTEAEPTNDETEEDKEDSSQATDDAEPESDDQPEEDPEQIYEIGDSATLNDWTITVTDMKIVKSIEADYGAFLPNEDGNKFLQIFVTVDNDGKESDTFLPYVCMGDDVYAKVFFTGDYEFSSTNLIGYDHELHNTSINPLSSKTGEIVFEIPEKVSESDDELLLQFMTSSDSLKFKIR